MKAKTLTNKSLSPLTAVIVATLLIVVTSAQGQAAENTWVLSERTLPVPAAASKELKDSITQAPQPDVAKHIQNTSITTKEQWAELIAMAGKAGTATAKAMAARLKVTIEEEKIAGVTVYSVMPANIKAANKNHLFIHIHGGAYVLGSGQAGLYEAIIIADRAAIPVVSIDYRMPPEHPFPAAIDDVVAVWKSLIKDREPKSMALGGTSTGGALALAATSKFIALGIPVPGAIFAGTPWADLTKTGDSNFTNEGVDYVLTTYDGFLAGAAQLYAGEHALTDPLISPVYGEFKGFPPTYLITGTRDLLLSDTVRIHRKLRAAGVDADLNVYEGSSHAEYLKVLDSPESHQAFAELEEFLVKHLKK